MYKEKLINIIQESAGIHIKEEDYNKDIRGIGVDSISFIRILADVEVQLDKEIEYTFMDDNEIISVDVINQYLLSKGVNHEIGD